MATRFALLGTGYWARTVHGPGLAAHPGVELAGVWGRDGARTAAAASELGTTAWDDVDALLAAVDAVAVALPPDVQAPLAARAAEAGCHLLLDKPLALDVADADRVVAAASAAGVSSVIFFTARFRPELAPWWAKVAASPWLTASVANLSSIDQPGSPYAGSAWRRQRGGLWDIGPHALAGIVAALGPVAEVRAGRGPAGLVHAILSHEGGGSSVFTVTLDAPPAAQSDDTTLAGPEGVERMPRSASTSLDAFRVAIDALLTASQGGDPHPCDASFGRHVVAVLAAAETSLATGCAQPVG